MSHYQMVKDCKYLEKKFGKPKYLHKILTSDKFIDFLLKRKSRTEIFASLIQCYKDNGSISGKLPLEDKGVERIINRWKFEGLIS